MALIIPAILAKDFKELKEKAGMVAGLTSWVHLDFADGTLTKEAAWPYIADTEEFQRLKKEESGLPYWQDLNFEAHLMVNDPESRYEDWVRAGAERVIVHREAFKGKEAASEFLEKLQKYFGFRDTDFGIEVGLAANMETGVEDIMPHVLESDYIHLMSINHIGKQGEPFNEGIFEKIQKIRQEFPEAIISVDGGVNLENAERLMEAGVERLVVGSAIFSDEDPVGALEEFLALNE